jgi:hypothetical protein
MSGAPPSSETTHCVANLSYVYDHTCGRWRSV